MAVLPIPIETPCGTKTIKVPIPISIPVPTDLLDFLALLLNLEFPPKLPLLTPPCSVIDHLGSAPEPPEDSEPDP